ncbi:outer membrane autotransporter barrel domain protein [compost metagenome]
MLVFSRFPSRPLSAAIRFAALSPLLFLAPGVQGETLLDGVSRTVNATTPSDSWRLINAASLSATGATTRQIRAEGNSTVTLSGTRVEGQANRDGIALASSTGAITSSQIIGGAGAAGVSLINATLTVTDSSIQGSTTGLRMAQTAGTGIGSTAQVNNSQIVGGDIGASISSLSALALQGSQITGNSAEGVRQFGKLSAVQSSITGATVGISMLDDPSNPGAAALTLDGSQVTGQGGAAIMVGVVGGVVAGNVKIDVLNGSTLVSSDGVMAQLNGASSALMNVQGSALTGNILAKDSSTLSLAMDNSRMTGDVIADAGATADVGLRNGAELTGRLHNLNSLAIDSQARWVMVEDSAINRLSLDGGNIRFGDSTVFHTLTVGDLSGSGVFEMNTDFTSGQTDFLEVTGTATGAHQLLVSSSGQDPINAESVRVVHTASGDATFSLVNGAVDLGAWSYGLAQKPGESGSDWYLDPTSKVISPGTRSVMALFNTAPTVLYGEMSTLRSRMGELRLHDNKAGGWIRAYGNKYNVSQSSGLAYKQVQQGFSLGADAPLPLGDGQWLGGVMAGHSNSDLDLSRGTSGTVKSYYLGGYATWMDQASGYYFDGVLKFNRFNNESKVSLSDGQRAKGDYDNNAVSASLEFGRHIALGDGYFVEPYTQVMGAVIQGKDYSLDNDLQAEGDRTHSLLGKLGTTAGRNFDLGEGRTLQPYVRVAYAHEFAKNNEVKVNSNTFNNDLSGSRGELGTGLALSLNDKWQVHVDLDYANGEQIEQPWGGNFGVRYNW